MNTRELLIEASYNFGHIIDLIYKNIIEPTIIKMKSAKMGSITKDITEYLKDLVSKYSQENFNLYLSLRKSPKSQPQWFAKPITVGNEEKNYVIYLNISKKDIATEKMEIFKKYFREMLMHELSHFMDTIRSKHIMTQSDPITTSYKYYNDPLEFNAFFHEIKDLAKKDKKRWNKIQSMKDLRDAFLNEIPSLQDLLRVNLQGYKNVEKKFLRRLARENLLPKNIIAKSF
jgi:hypothetical protein